MNKLLSCKILFISFLFLLIALANNIPAQNNLFTKLDTLTFKLTEKQKELLTTIKERPSTKKVGLYLISDLKQILNDSCLSIDIFTFTNLEITKKKIELTNFDNFVYYGSIRNFDGDILLVVIDKELTGTLSIDKNIYRIEPLGFGAHVLIEIDQSGFPPEHPAEYNNDILLYDKELEIEGNMSDQSGSVIDILVAYTSSAAIAHGNINGLIITAVSESNQSYQNSNVSMRINLVHTVHVNYIESGNMFTDLVRFSGTTDGHMDEIHGLRDYYGGDVCILIVNDETVCGLAPVLPQASSAFGVVHYDCAAGNFSFGHEIGHIQGCRHDMFVDPNLFPFTYGHGYVYLPDEWRTIMAYNDECDCSDEVTPCPPLLSRNTPDYPWCNTLQYWSNPDVYYGGQAMGTVEYEDDARVLDETASTIASFRTPLLEIWANDGKSANQTATAYNNGRRLVRDGASYLHLVFASGGQIFYRKRTPWGEWQQTIKISNGSLNDFPCIVVSNSGDLYAAWQRKTSTNTYEVVFAMSMDWGATWATEDRYVLTTVTSSLDPLPVIQSDIQGYSKVIAYKTNSGLKSYWTNWHYPYILNWTYYSITTNSNDSYPALSSENGTPQKPVLAYQNSSDGKIYYRYFTTSWSTATNLSNIVPGSGIHQTPTITNIPNSTQLHVAWKKLIGTGSTIYDHLVVHRRATNYNTWPNEWFGTYYNSQEYPSITGLATNNVDLLYQTPPQFGTPYIYKMRFWGNYWDSPVSVATNGRYPSVSSGQTTANYVWTSGSTSPFTVMMGSGLSKETVVDPTDYYTRSISLLDSTGSYLEIKIHDIAFEFADGSNQKLNYTIAGLDSFNMTIQNCYDSLATTLLSVVPLNARKMILDISISGVGINNLFGNTNYIPLSMKLINNQNVTLRSVQNNFSVLNGTLQEIRRTFSIPLTGLGIVPGVTQVRANLKLLNLNPAVGVFASLGHIFDYTSLLENPKKIL